MAACRNCGTVLTGHAAPKLCRPCYWRTQKTCGDDSCRRDDPCGVCRERRRVTAARSQQRRLAEYRELIADRNVPAQWSRWAEHMRELRGQAGRVYDRRLTRGEHRAFWLERFTLAEIRQMAGALEDVA